VQIPPKEVNPKQEKPGAKGLSNYVRLPYIGLDADSNGRRIMIEPQSEKPITFDRFYSAAELLRVSEHQLAKFADKYRPPSPKTADSIGVVEFDAAKLNPWCRKILAEGPAPWRFEDGMGGRSALLQRLAYEVRKSEQPKEVAKAVLLAADDAWGKYVDRSNREAILDKMVATAYG